VMAGLDEFDRKILTQLRLNARITNHALGEVVGLSPSACLRRVRILEQNGTIRGYTALLGGSMPEEGTTAMVQVVLVQQTKECLTRFEAALHDHPEIREWYLMTGEGDYFLRIQISGIDDYERFHREVLSLLPGVSRITSSFAICRPCSTTSRATSSPGSCAPTCEPRTSPTRWTSPWRLLVATAPRCCTNPGYSAIMAPATSRVSWRNTSRPGR